MIYDRKSKSLKDYRLKNPVRGGGNKMAKKEDKKKMPIKKFVAGGISASIWENKHKDKKTDEVTAFNTISLQRTYKDAEGEWEHTNSLGVRDLPKASLVLAEAYKFLSLRGEKEESDEDDEDEVTD